MVYLPNETVIEKQRKVVERRQLFARVFTPEVLDALAEFLGVEDVIFAFHGDMDPYHACQLDAKAGVVRGIRWEVEHLDEAVEVLRAMENACQEGEEVGHA